MAAERLSPVDETGMPLPLAPTGLSPFEKDNSDWHHHFHPRRSELLTGSNGALAVRHSRVQITHRTQHDRYHQVFEGPPLPETETYQFSLVVLASAGYIPSQAVDSRSRRGPKIVKVKDAQRQRLWESGEIRPDNLTVIRAFLGEFAVKQDLTDVNEGTIDEFLHTHDQDRKKYLGHWLLAHAIDHATEPVLPVYSLARRRGLINPHAPRHPRSFVQFVLGPPSARNKYISQLEDRLVA
jgi:hypothetical protein